MGRRRHVKVEIYYRKGVRLTETLRYVIVTIEQKVKADVYGI